MDLLTFIQQLEDEGTIDAIARNPRTQFGTRTRRMLGATLLPERPVTENAYREENIRYRSVIANAGTRYSPVQLKKGVLAGSFEVFLAESDIGSEFTGQQYDALLNFLRNNASMSAMASLVRWLTTTVAIPLTEWNERARWQAIVDAVVQLRGNNGYTEDVAYSDPAGHRVAVGGDWWDPAYDPFDDIFAGAQILTDKGFTVSRIFTSRRIVGALATNPNVATRTNRIVVSASGQIGGINGRVSLADINAALQADGLPVLELNDLSYRTSTGTGRFLKDNVFVMVATTGRDEALDLADGRVEVLPDTLGYTAIGRPTGQNRPGRVIMATPFRNKPPRIEGEGWQTSLPVITEPEAIVVLKDIDPAP